MNKNNDNPKDRTLIEDKYIIKTPTGIRGLDIIAPSFANAERISALCVILLDPGTDIDPCIAEGYIFTDFGMLLSPPYILDKFQINVLLLDFPFVGEI